MYVHGDIYSGRVLTPRSDARTEGARIKYLVIYAVPDMGLSVLWSFLPQVG